LTKNKIFDIVYIMKRLVSQIFAGILGFWLAIKFIPGVEFADSWQVLVLAGLVLGIINFFIKPIFKIITLPLRILTFGLFGLVINMGMVWIVTLIFPKLKIVGLLPLFLTSIVIWALNLIFPFLIPKK
jgi:putative membrane protein